MKQGLSKRRLAIRVTSGALSIAAAFILMAASAGSVARAAGELATGSKSGLPVPRFVSIKPDRVKVRGGPTWDHDVTWIYTRAGLPVEITAESDNWRRIRDWEGSEGWVYHSMLSGRRTAVVTAKEKDALVPLQAKADAGLRYGREPAVGRARYGQAMHRKVVPHRRPGLRRLDRAGAALGRLSEREGGVAERGGRSRCFRQGRVRAFQVGDEVVIFAVLVGLFPDAQQE